MPDSWKLGPKLLYDYKCTWPETSLEKWIPEDDAEVKSCLAAVSSSAVSMETDEESLQLIDHFSSFYKLKKAMVWLIRIREYL